MDLARFVLPFLLLVPILADDIRLGIVGTDQPHGCAFTRLLNDATSANHVPGARVVAAYKGGSPDLADSVKYGEQCTEELRTKWNIEIVDDIATLCSKVDGVLLESIDGRTHLRQAREVIAMKKPLFIDKPLASTLKDAREIAHLAKKAGVPWFSSSILRYSPSIVAAKSEGAIGVTAWSPGPIEEHHQLDLSWYGIHGVETLYTLMGPGCEEVTRTSTPSADVVVGRWRDGRIGTVRVVRPHAGYYGAIVFGPKSLHQTPARVVIGYGPLVAQIVKFFQSHTPPFPNDETIEMFSFMDAAQRSKAAGGKPTRLR